MRYPKCAVGVRVTSNSHTVTTLPPNNGEAAAMGSCGCGVGRDDDAEKLFRFDRSAWVVLLLLLLRLVEGGLVKDVTVVDDAVAGV